MKNPGQTCLFYKANKTHVIHTKCTTDNPDNAIWFQPCYIFLLVMHINFNLSFWSRWLHCTCTYWWIYVLLGYLCGQCGNGKGVSALLNKCVSCGNASVLLIIALGRQYVVCIVHVCYIIISHSWHHSDHYYSIVFTLTKAMAVSIPILPTGTYAIVNINIHNTFLL